MGCYRHIDNIDQPLLMITGSNAQLLYLTLDAFLNATNTKTKELFLIDGAPHIEMYWKTEYVLQVINGVNFIKQIFIT